MRTFKSLAKGDHELSPIKH